MEKDKYDLLIENNGLSWLVRVTLNVYTLNPIKI